MTDDVIASIEREARPPIALPPAKKDASAEAHKAEGKTKTQKP
jgi:hypothetical protein